MITLRNAAVGALAALDLVTPAAAAQAAEPAPCAKEQLALMEAEDVAGADDVVDVSDNDKVKAAASKAAEAKQRWGKALEKARATEPDTKEREAASQEVGRAYEQKVAADEELARVTEEVRKEARAATAQAVLDERQALKQCLRDHSA